MKEQEFVEVIRRAQAAGHWNVSARLAVRYKGCLNVLIGNLDGAYNGNPNDLWIESPKKVLGRAYLGSRRMKQNLEGWPERIASVST